MVGENKNQVARLKFAVAWLITLLVSVAVTAVGIAWGKAVDCKPGEVDGQCGLGTFLELLLRCRGRAGDPLRYDRLPSDFRLQAATHYLNPKLPITRLLMWFGGWRSY